MDEPPVIDDAPLADPAEVRRAMEFYSSRGWTDGLPVVPVTESYLAEFLAATARAPSDVVLPMPHLNRALTVRLAAINAALAGCLPAYFPVVLAAWDSFLGDGGVSRAIWQSTTGTAPFTVVNGPVRTAIGLNSREIDAGVLDSTMSTPSNAEGPSGSTGKVSPLNSTVLPALRSEARNLIEPTGNDRSASRRVIMSPTAPLAPTTATLFTATSPTGRRKPS